MRCRETRGERLERRYRRARARRVGLGALDVERRSEARPLSRGYQAQRLVLRCRDRAHGLELVQRADQREVVGRDVGHHQQAHARALSSAAIASAAAADAPARRRPERSISQDTSSRRRRLHRCPERPAWRASHSRCRERARQRRPRCSGNSHERLIVSPARAARTRSAAILMSRFSLRRAAHEVGQHRVAVAFPPRGLGLGLLRGGSGVLSGHLD